MIYFNFNIRNPFTRRFDIVKSYNGSSILKYKHWEFNIYKTSDIIGINLEITHRCDHAGISLQISLLGYNIEYHLYDIRHWDSRAVVD